MLGKIHYKDQCSMVSQTKKVKCPMEKKETEAKYTLAFHAVGKQLCLSIFMENKYYVKLHFQKRVC